MKTLPLTPEIESNARRVIWFEEPQKAVADPLRIVAYTMTYGDYEDVDLLCQLRSDDDLREASENPLGPLRNSGRPRQFFERPFLPSSRPNQAPGSNSC